MPVSTMRIRIFMRITAVFLAVSMIFAASWALAAEKGADKAAAKTEAPAKGDAPEGDQMIKLGDPVVATVGGKEVKRSEVFSFISSLPEQVRQMPVQNLFPLALEQVINNKVIGGKADMAKLEGDAEVIKTMAQAKDQIIRGVYIERQVNAQINQKKLLKAYEEMLDQVGDIQEIHAHHILVDTEDQAKDVIKRLDGGAKFEDLVKEYTAGKGPKSGGDLGYFAKNEMVPEFADAAFALEPGKYSKTPVKTQFGWHVIKVDEKRKRPEPEFEAVKPQLEAQLRQKILADLLDQWQKEAKIKKFDINGEPIK